MSDFASVGMISTLWAGPNRVESFEVYQIDAILIYTNVKLNLIILFIQEFYL